MGTGIKVARRTPWWHGYLAALSLLVVIDVMLRAWCPHPLRLPDQFSAGYLERYIMTLRTVPQPVIVLGDSCLWGYRIEAADAAPSVLARMLPKTHFANLAFEGGSPVNSELLLRYLLRNGVHPRLLVFNVNQKEFNPLDSAFKRIRPSLALAAESDLAPEDRAELEFQDGSSLNDRLSRLIERFWVLYRYRVDIREALFKTDDLATYLTHLENEISGYTERKARTHPPTAERFSGTYDLTPLNPSNLSYRRLLELALLIQDEHLPAIAILTPTNHALLGDYINNPIYAANIKTVGRVLREHGITTVNLDSAIPKDEFIDNDHLTPEGSFRLATLLRSVVTQALP